ncbi:MAG: NAD-dependent epimerase/dehydratase family protein [Actinomycetota bacterium]
MRALVIGARGAVGRVIAAELRELGHDVTPTGRSAGSGWVQLDLRAPDAMAVLAAKAAAHDVVVNASGVEDPRIVASLSGAVLVEISATARYLDRLAQAPTSGGGIVLGAGLVPGLSTILLASLDAKPGEDLDLAVILGGGERHGAAAVAWTAELAGQPVYSPPEDVPIVNFREHRRLPSPTGPRIHVRADFPDHVLIGRQRESFIRSYLATDSRISTAALGAVGRFPALRAVVRHAPHLGSTRWSLTAMNRQSGMTRTAQGTGQSEATGKLTALLADAASRRGPFTTITADRLLSLSDIGRIRGFHLSG